MTLIGKILPLQLSGEGGGPVLIGDDFAARLARARGRAAAAREMDQQRALISVAGRFAAAVGVSAIVALFFVIMIPASRDHAQQADGGASATPGILQSIKTALYRPGQKDDDLKPALSEFQPILASTRAGQPAISREQSEALLQQFVQWRQKPNSTEAPQ